jgi:starch synthase
VVDDEGVEYVDNDERTIFFTRGVMETVKKLRWTPDIIHCQGWMSALAPLYIKKAYNDDPFFKKSKVVYSLFEEEFTQPFRPEFSDNLILEGIKSDDLSSIKGKEINFEALSKLAVDFSDGVIQSSKTVNKELLKYVTDQKKKFLPYADKEDYADDYINFYDSL